MRMHTLSTTWHTLHILLLMMLRPAALFARINALPWYRDMLRQWASEVIGNQPATVLEAGCATGELSKHLAQLGHRVTGVDASPAMLARAKQSNAINAAFMQGNVMQLPFATGQFQHVLAASLINVVDDPVTALREMARVCQPGGSVSVLVPLAGIDRNRITELADELKLTGFSRAALLFWLSMARKLSVHILKEHFQSAGINQLKCQIYLSEMLISITGKNDND